jgi:type III restriction enzyme
MDMELKKVRKIVDYLFNHYPAETAGHENHRSNLIYVVNSTGTPYFNHQPLKVVVIRNGLSEGIRDGILKELAGNFRAFDFEGNIEAYLAHMNENFLGIMD